MKIDLFDFFFNNEQSGEVKLYTKDLLILHMDFLYESGNEKPSIFLYWYHIKDHYKTPITCWNGKNKTIDLPAFVDIEFCINNQRVNYITTTIPDKEISSPVVTLDNCVISNEISNSFNNRFNFIDCIYDETDI